MDGPKSPEADERRAGAARSLLKSSAPLRREALPGRSGTRGQEGGKAEGGKLPPHRPKAGLRHPGRAPHGPVCLPPLVLNVGEGVTSTRPLFYTDTKKHLGLEFHCH